MHLEMGFREDQPKLDPGKYGWIREEKSKSLQPTTVPANVELAPKNISNLIRCSCSSLNPCRTSRCGCNTA